MHTLVRPTAVSRLNVYQNRRDLGSQPMKLNHAKCGHPAVFSASIEISGVTIHLPASF